MREVMCQNWADIDLDVLASNAKHLKGYLDPDVRLLAVVKADGYGHGALPAARVFWQNGADYLGVGTLLEAVELREAGISDAPILVFTPMEPTEAPVVVEYGLTATIAHLDSAHALSSAAAAAGTSARAHVKLDTGLSRFGILPDEARSFVRAVYDLSSIQWEGIYSHFANGYNGPNRMSRLQHSRFMTTVLDLAAEGIEFSIKHMANSAAVFESRDYHLDMVRVGNALYGLRVPDNAEIPDLRDSWKFRARIIQVKEVPARTPVGYGGRYVTPRAMRVATVGVGLSDGFGLEVAAKHYQPGKMLRSALRVVLERLGLAKRAGLTPVGGWVRVGDRIAPVVGQLATQHCMVDITDIPGAREGDFVELVAGRTAVNHRVTRVYSVGGEVRYARVLGEYVKVVDKNGYRLQLADEARYQVAPSQDG